MDNKLTTKLSPYKYLLNDKNKLAAAKKLNPEMSVKQKSLEHIVVKKDRILFNAFRLNNPTILQKKTTIQFRISPGCTGCF
ncbi:MAG: hypothetical protein ABI707_07810 [Ferruginibacter sp.]